MAVILAGGEGERLSILSQERAKPAVPFGGKYRIIDFTLSNCVNSDIDDVVVLTQYNPRSLNDHIGLGRPWDLDRNRGGVKLLQPYIARGKVAEWYRGTADAVLRNINVIEHDSVRHRSWSSPATTSTRWTTSRSSPPTAATAPTSRSRSGASRSPRRPGWASSPSTRTTASPSGRRSPSSPRATSPRWASTSSPRRRSAAGCREDRVDFGGDVIPAMLEAGARVFGYRYNGYWQDVGTIQSFWEANMRAPRRRPGARPVRQGLGHPHPLRGTRPGQGRADGAGPPEPHQPRLRHRRHGRQLASCRRACGSTSARSCATRSSCSTRSSAPARSSIGRSSTRRSSSARAPSSATGPYDDRPNKAGARPPQHRHHRRRQARGHPARRAHRAQREDRGGRPLVRLRGRVVQQRRVGRRTRPGPREPHDRHERREHGQGRTSRGRRGRAAPDARDKKVVDAS